ncbi:MAG: MBL fold metallo-hydrolase [Acidimicrobiia bacterium]|nr:MBL fold metallo-hydrolase [Acidimicrobiia bacterium]
MNITRILAPNPGPFTGAGTNSYVIEADGEAVIVDPGPEIDTHLDAIRAAVSDLMVVGVLVTHHHLDHSPAANPLAAEYGVPSYGFGSYGGFQAISAIADGDGVHVGTEMIAVLHTPGHTPDSLCYAVEDGVFTGDAIKSGTTVVVEDMSDYMSTLQRLIDLAPARIYPGHGDVIDDPQAVLAGYTSHRRAREQQIVNALNDGPLTTEAVVGIVYPDLDPALVPLAAQSADAHLRKLVDDGVAFQTDDGWALL